MKAVMCRDHGDLDVLKLEDVESPSPGAGEVKIRVHACGINFADSLMAKGTYQETPDLPFIPGAEVAGEVIELGEGVSGFSLGDRVMGLLSGGGGYAEEAVNPAANFSPVPDKMEYEAAASFAITYGTSYLALRDRARLRPGEVLLVHGAAGGVGLTAVELGKLMGARVIATAGGPDKLKIAQEAGADELIDYLVEDIRTRVKDLTDQKGADVIYDPVGGEVFDASLRCVNFEGRILIIGFAGGAVQQIPANHVMVKNVDIIGFNRGPYSTKRKAESRAANTQLMDWYVEGKLRPYVSRTVPLKGAIEALRDVIERRTTGKVVITP